MKISRIMMAGLIGLTLALVPAARGQDTKEHMFTTYLMQIKNSSVRPDVLTEAARTFDMGPDLYVFNAFGQRRGTVPGIFGLGIKGETDQARDEAAQRFVDWLREYLNNAYEEEKTARQEELKRAQRVPEEARLRLEELQAQQRELLSKAGSTALTRQAVTEQMRNLEGQTRELEMDRTGLEARNEAIQEQIAHTTIMVEQEAQEDPVAQQLAEVVAIREGQLKRTEQLKSSRRRTSTKSPRGGGMPGMMPSGMPGGMPGMMPGMPGGMPGGMPAGKGTPFGGRVDRSESETDRPHSKVPAALEPNMSVDYQDVELREVINDLRQRTGANIVVLWGELDLLAGIREADPITLQLKNVSAATVLEHVLQVVASGKYAPAIYTVDDEGVVTIRAEQPGPDMAASSEEVNGARLALAEARAQLAQRREEVRMAGGGDMVQQWKRELAELAVHGAELGAKLELARLMSEEIRERNLLAMADDYERLRMTVLQAQQDFHNALGRLSRFQEDQGSQPPVVELVGKVQE